MIPKKRARLQLALVLLATFIAVVTSSHAQTNDTAKSLRDLTERSDHLEARLTRQLNELLWFQRLGDVALVEQVRFTGPSPRAQTPGSNEVVISALTFLPKAHRHWRKLPLIVLAHGEIHGNLTTDEDANVVRELVQQGYAVIAPDYRGSTGYGPEFWHLIDYGGLEIEDVHAARQFMLARSSRIDPHRVGIIGWSHGGAIALLTVFAHPGEYQACYAGVPVSDLEERIRLRGKGYEELFSAPYHLGKSLADAPEEYRRRSPAWNAEKLRTPLLIHANNNDEDVNIQEVERLLAALRNAGKEFQYHIYTNAAGGHLFNRLDTPAALESRREIWRFLARYLHPAATPK